ncbi:MAG: hypothetical protein HC772_10935 [Leptolyngbyaceae cyanobacterium CRU_2_3]|nr:hypothetical protein [Leptolyngbyaceae cyanobacterium CRU_2_3]
MAKQAEVPGVGLVLPDPGNTIYLTPAPQRSLVEPEVNLPPPQPIPRSPFRILGNPDSEQIPIIF